MTIPIAPGKTAEFLSAFKALQAITQQKDGREQYELFQSLDERDKVVLLERWVSQALLDKHMDAERTRNTELIDAVVAMGARYQPDYRTFRGLASRADDLRMALLSAVAYRQTPPLDQCFGRPRSWVARGPMTGLAASSPRWSVRTIPAPGRSACARSYACLQGRWLLGR